MRNASAAKPDCRSGAELLAQAQETSVRKTSLPAGRAFALSVLAGMMIGMGASFMTLVKSDGALSFAASQVLGGLCFSLGLICVIVAGAELFTGNMLMVAGAWSKRCSWGAMLKNWVIVYVGNLAGSLLLVAIMLGAGFSNMNGGAVGSTMVDVAYAKMSLPSGVVFWRGVLCNWLVCLAVWMGFSGRTVIDKMLTTIFPVTAFVACGFEHCVANMFFLPMGVVQFALGGYAGTGDVAAIAHVLTVGNACRDIALSTIGNIVGGALFVGLAYQFAYGVRGERSARDA